MAAFTWSSVQLLVLVPGVAIGLASSAIAGDVSVRLDAGTGFSVKNSTGAVERLRVDEATGNVSRNGALFVHTTGVNNLFVGPNAGNTATTGFGKNSAFGGEALLSNTTGSENSAFGNGALRANTTGAVNSAVGYAALRANTTGNRNSALGDSALRANTTGHRNVAVGYAALAWNVQGYENTAVGTSALDMNTGGMRNTAVGKDALFHNSYGVSNSAFGHSALFDNNNGVSNSALGNNALRSNTSGSANTAIGSGALAGVTTGQYNVAVGANAGNLQTYGSNNIYLANPGVAGESGTIRIGIPGVLTHTRAFIAGIHNHTVTSGSTVLVNANGELGTVVSAGRFKEAVEEMGEASERLMALRPVRFRYRKDAGGDGYTEEYGLIAEEVSAVAPELVIYDEAGQPFTVKYHVMAPMLLNEAQKQRRSIEEQKRVIAELSSRLALLESEVGAGGSKGGTR
jgi:hypothetical protein